MNKVWLTGRITKDLELRHTNSGTPTCQFVIATNRPVMRDGERQVDFITCVIWNKAAENLVKYQRKGNLIGVYGEFRNESYEVNGEKRYKSYILVNEVEYLESRKEMPKEEEEDFKQISSKTKREEQIQIEDSDLPF